MKRYLLAAGLLAGCSNVFAQPTNIKSTTLVAEQVMLGNYQPSTYMPSTVIDDPATIAAGIAAEISTDSMKAYLEGLRSFKNRNTGSDTVSSNKGIGAARRWVYSKFQQFSAQRENRLIPSYLQFDLDVCQTLQHRNVFAVLPGRNVSDNQVTIIEAHMDSRCKDLCDSACLAEGMEDNGSGTALVMELARVMSKYTFERTIIFTTLIGEEQGLVGAEAFALYCKQKGINVKGVLNNDVIGGIVCGQTSSAPSCPGLGAIDSTHVRLFSAGNFNSPHKQLSRFIKLEYGEMLKASAAVPVDIMIMSAEDRTGRGGDHIPFRENGFTAMRFTSANEHGNADVTAAGYADRQHTSDDILGVDTDNDTVIDSLFVNLNYLKRNATINGNAAAMMALGPKPIDFIWLASAPDEIKVHIDDPENIMNYRIAVRDYVVHDWQTVHSVSGSKDYTVKVTPGRYAVSVASVDDKGIESTFSRELTINTNVEETELKKEGIELLQNKPNPFDEQTTITVLVDKKQVYKKAFISVYDIAGKEIKRLDIQLKEGVNDVLYEHGYNASGTYTYTLVVDGKPVQSKRMVFAN